MKMNSSHLGSKAIPKNVKGHESREGLIGNHSIKGSAVKATDNDGGRKGHAVVKTHLGKDKSAC